MNYSARIIENDKVRQAECAELTPADALFVLVTAEHIRKGATVKLGCAYWEGDRFVSNVYQYRHLPECDTHFASAWKLVGSELVQYISVKPE